MNILVFGHSVIDKINYGKGEIIKPGGIFYTIAALVNITDSKDNIYVCTTIDEVHEIFFSSIYKRIKPNYISYTSNIPVVKLNIFTNREREEKYENVTGNLQFNISDLNRFDGILINMITGFDLSIKQLR